jgi:SAM-dependent methyltransferase
MLALSRALFGRDLALSCFPRLKSLRGFGISDSDAYSGRLEEIFSYTNTFYHREPRFDLMEPDPTEFGKYDFVVCSEVLEHVPGPVDRAFKTLSQLLKPAGLLVLTVPYSVEDGTIEHFPEPFQGGLVTLDGKTVLVNRSKDGRYEVFDKLVFHSGHGSTLEMRVFAETDVRTKLADAGFANVRIEAAGNQEYGIDLAGPCSLPIIASRSPFTLCLSGIGEVVDQLVASRSMLKDAKESRWVRLGRWLRFGPKIRLDI